MSSAGFFRALATRVRSIRASFARHLRATWIGACALIGAWATPLGAASPNALTFFSARATVGPDSEALLGSFTIESTAPKSVLIRAVGPSLAVFGVAGTLADPVLELYDGKGVLVQQNDNWSGSALSNAFASVGAFSLVNGSRDAALLVSLPAGTYTARVTGAGNTSGIALMEIYEADNTPRLVHASVRQLVTSGTGALVMGFGLNGPATQGVVVRGVGVASGYSNALADPRISMFGPTGQLIGSNDNGTGADVTSASATAGLAPLVAGSTDAALVQSLAPGNYTVQVTDAVGSNAGLAMAEVALVDGRPASFAPALATVPTSLALVGRTVRLSASYVGKPAPTILWRQSGSVVPGGTLSTLTLNPSTLPLAGDYTVTFTNSAGTTIPQP